MMSKHQKRERDRSGEAPQAAKQAKKLARAAEKLAARRATLERREEARASALHRRLGQIEALAPAQAGSAPGVATLLRQQARRRALLIVNSKSGPNKDSLLHVRELVAMLAAHGIDAEVSVKLRKKVAARQASKAAKAGVPLIIAAGGDGTVEAVARGVAGTKTVLGIIPLGTYNNVATSLGISADPAEACALIGFGVPRAIDVGCVSTKHPRKSRLFLEVSGVGLAAALAPVGQHFEKGRWQQVAKTLPVALAMSPTEVEVRLDGAAPARRRHALLVEVANAPRMGAGLIEAPDARMDDGLLDVAIYNDMDQALLAARFVAVKAGTAGDDPRIERTQARRITVRTASPLPVVADSKVIGVTPAKIEVRPGALLVIPGHGPGLSLPAPEPIVEVSRETAHSLVAVADATGSKEPLLEVVPGRPHNPLTAVATAIVPAAGKAVDALSKLRALALPAAAIGGLAAVPLLHSVRRRWRW